MFGPSPLNAWSAEFVKRYPDVSRRCFDWNTPEVYADAMKGKRVLAIGHSFGGQRTLHQCEQADTQTALLQLMLIDPVRYTKADAVNVALTPSSDALDQEFDRDPMPVNADVDGCVAFLREGGQSVLAYPRSSPVIGVDQSQVDNQFIACPNPLTAHVDICSDSKVLGTFWNLCKVVFGDAA